MTDNDPAMAAPCLMFQGTASNVGKSLITAAVCRSLQRRGIRVAPYKSQNMSNHSFGTRDGHEVAAAQAVQAHACRLDPQFDMSPIILKPQNNLESQVVVHGQVTGELTALDYGRRREKLIDAALQSLARLRERYELLVIEGAGSPAEINLQKHEIVNMFIARHADAPVILIGDIDRGGVFASLVGTLALLSDEDRSRVKGFIINKFRGDVRLLEPGLKDLEQLTGVPVLGVIPVRSDLFFPDEDSLSLDIRNDHTRNEISIDAACKVDIIRGPWISNVDDFNYLEYDVRFDVQLATTCEDVRSDAMILLPGSKSTIRDLQWLRDHGFEEIIKTAADSGTFIFGMCGGFQMLGTRILDPDGVESEEKDIEGLGLLPVTTHFYAKKHVGQVIVSPSIEPFEKNEKLLGYEIHCGYVEPVSTTEAAQPFLTILEGEHLEAACLMSSRSNKVFGTLVHGLFADPRMREALYEWAMDKPAPDIEDNVNLDWNLDAWADHLERHVSVQDLHTIIQGEPVALKYQELP